MPGQMSVEAGPVRELFQPAAQPVGPARRVVTLEEDMRLRVRRLTVRAPQLQTARNQRLRAVQLIHLVIRERVPGEEPPIVTERRTEPVELCEHFLALLHAAVVEVAAQPLQHDRRIAGRLLQVIGDPGRRL